MNPVTITSLSTADAERVLELYEAVADDPRSGLSRERDEMTYPYVEHFLSRARQHGVSLGATVDDRLVGEIHVWRMGPRQFQHVLTDLTVAVLPALQGRGIGSRLFRALFEFADALDPPIHRIELMVRSGNLAAACGSPTAPSRMTLRWRGCGRSPPSYCAVLHTSRATSTTSSSLRHWSASEISLP